MVSGPQLQKTSHEKTTYELIFQALSLYRIWKFPIFVSSHQGILISKVEKTVTVSRGFRLWLNLPKQTLKFALVFYTVELNMSLFTI